jgi:hypothetical protein
MTRLAANAGARHEAKGGITIRTGGKRHVADGDHVPEGVDKIIVDLHHRMKCMAEGLSAVRGLIGCSHGVAGLHLNGEVAAWSELEGDGQFAEWLEPFNHAEDVMRRM